MELERPGHDTSRARLRELEGALADAQRQIRDLLEVSLDWVWETDAGLRFTRVAGRLEETLGISVVDLIGRSLEELANDREDAKLQQHLGEMRSHRQFRDFIFRINTPRGLRHVRASGKPLLDAAGACRGYRGVASDVTEEFDAAARAETLYRRFAEAIEFIPASLLLLDPDDRIVICNSATKQYFPRVGHLLVQGTRFEDLVRVHVASGFVREVGSDAEEWIDNRMRAHRAANVNILRATDDGRWVQITERRTSDGGTIGIRLDVTELKERERALAEKAQEVAEYAKELEHSNAELEQFAYVASHDLQEPLRMVASYCQLLQRRYKDKLDAEADEFIGFAVEGASRMQRLISDLLSYSRVGRRGDAFQPLDANELVRLALANLQRAVEESGAQIEIGALPRVTGDRTLLLQLFQNLIGIAIKFRREEPPAVRIRADADADGNFWHFTVADNGIGIEAEYRERVFLIFQRLHERDKYPGTGIGLAIARKVVEYHGGRIWVESMPGSGSRFHFTLPAAPNEPQR